MSSKKNPPMPALPCTGVETHAHLNSPRYNDDRDEVIERARKAGVKNFGQVFLSPEAYRESRDYFASQEGFFFLMGIHPTEAHQFDLKILDETKAIIEKDPLIKAVGEVGLDYYWKDCPPELQKDFFARQISMAKELKLPLVLHCREAEKDSMDILKGEGMVGHPLLWHCFGGDPLFAQEVLDCGWHISIPGTVSFKRNDALREAVAMIPNDRIMIETDCPYLTPEPFRGKRNEPAYLAYTIEVMAKARKVSVEELWTLCGDNARRFFDL